MPHTEMRFSKASRTGAATEDETFVAEAKTDFLCHRFLLSTTAVWAYPLCSKCAKQVTTRETELVELGVDASSCSVIFVHLYLPACMTNKYHSVHKHCKTTPISQLPEMVVHCSSSAVTGLGPAHGLLPLQPGPHTIDGCVSWPVASAVNIQGPCMWSGTVPP